MPVEIEYKYVIKLDSVLEKKIIEIIEGDKVSILQLYLSGGGRVREIECPNAVKYEFTYKHKIDVGNFEINTTISREDFEIAQRSYYRKLKKHRFTFKTKTNKWEIDFFKNDSGETYFIMMECEVNEGELPVIDSLPSIIKENIIKYVDLDDPTYSSYNLCSSTFAKQLLSVQ